MTKPALKWIPEEHRYVPYDLPNGAINYSNDMETCCCCCKCGKVIKYGEAYTSREIHNEYGIGYMECEDCYNKALNKEFNNED